MGVSSPSSSHRHLRDRDEARSQRVTPVELFFDLVYVLAITQLSHLILDDLSAEGVAHAAFLLIVGLVGVDLHDLDGELVRPRLARGPHRPHRGHAREPPDGRGAAHGVRRPRMALRSELRRAPGGPQRRGDGAGPRPPPSRRVRAAAPVEPGLGRALARRRGARPRRAPAALDPGARLWTLPRPSSATGSRAAAARRRPTGTSTAATSPSAASSSSSSRSASRSS